MIFGFRNSTGKTNFLSESQASAKKMSKKQKVRQCISIETGRMYLNSIEIILGMLSASTLDTEAI